MTHIKLPSEVLGEGAGPWLLLRVTRTNRENSEVGAGRLKRRN